MKVSSHEARSNIKMQKTGANVAGNANNLSPAADLGVRLT